jgi:hypothetical protein
MQQKQSERNATTIRLIDFFCKSTRVKENHVSCIHLLNCLNYNQEKKVVEHFL